MVNWDADSATPGGPTSEDVLLRWLLTPENQKRWQSESHKKLCEEIVRDLSTHGITRNADAVDHKISRMKNKCKAVDKWLSKAGQYAAYHSGAATQKVKDGVRQRYPHYDNLAPLFGIADGGQPGTLKRSATDSEEKTPPKKQRATDEPSYRVQEIVDFSSSQQPDLSPLPSDTAFVHHTAQGHTSNVLEMFSRRAIGLFDTQEAKHVSFMGKEGKQRLVDCEIQRQKDLAKCQVEGEQKREEIRTTREKLISRHECLSAGVPKEIVDKAMPL
ncbi:hypothetical protein PPTG_00915 [Phytophthora nicotianae INRA-310]|uniref:Uncharacterized protein n=1 Tax=Phytophthora nicotianae (strain INRA-310) TaxID=761204 RepID=W2RJ69_PHYN3|nr:hypothetical protein PPTG_00915 [Phytophthora nicotianae INRA-310]ETN24694.1 hypothetical protein PPTG_00915 [Phytophthora nicotianae INRA-310]